MFPEVSKITVKRTLRRLCDDGNVETIGSGRASRYIGRRRATIRMADRDDTDPRYIHILPFA